MTVIPTIPNELRVDSWKRHRDIITAVVKGETGISQALREVKLAYDAVQWQYFNPLLPGPLPKPRTLEALDERADAIKDKKGQINNLKAKVAKVRTLCKTLGDKWERSAVVPKTTRVYVQRIMPQVCDAFDDDLDEIAKGDYTKARDEIVRVNKIALDMVKPWVKDLSSAILKVKADPTVANYLAEVHQNVRGVGTSISKIPKYKDFFDDTWNDMTEDSFMAGVKDGKAVTAKLAEVEAGLKQLKAALKA